jgi:peptide/nickel transport system ATP-binding protein
MMRPIIEAKNLVKDFWIGNKLFGGQHIRALNHVSFKLYPGRTLALVGESGSGKSTCANLLCKLYSPTQGEIFYRGREVSKLRSRKEIMNYRAAVQMIFQDPYSSLNPLHTVGYHLARPLILYTRVGAMRDLKARLFSLLESVELEASEQMLRKYPYELSGGQRQRVVIARTLAVGAQVVLADEPISMLDVSIRMGVLKLLSRLKTDKQIAFLYITHDLATARYFAEETAVLYRGNMVEWGDSDEVILKPHHPYTRLLIEAAPDPEKRFGDMKIDKWREELDRDHTASAVAVTGRPKEGAPTVEQIAANHFVSHSSS